MEWNFVCPKCKKKNEHVQIRRGVFAKFELMSQKIFVAGINLEHMEHVSMVLNIPLDIRCSWCNGTVSRRQIVDGARRWLMGASPEEMAEMLGLPNDEKIAFNKCGVK